MKDISIRSTPVLLVLAAISIGLLYLIENTTHEQEQNYFKDKMLAARLTEDCLLYLKETNFKDEVAIDNINDPNETKIIGSRYSSITSGRGSLPVKLGTANPNFSALIVELLREAGMKKGDHIAIGATGSFPALNIAASAAAQILELDVTYIASVTSSSWGANDPDYTYLDIHASLNKGGLITNQILASSIGANQDIGRGISPEGRHDAISAIHRNEVLLIDENSLQANVDKRVYLFDKASATKHKAIDLYMNIGGGIASLGSSENSHTLPSGLMEDVKLNTFADKKGIMFEMATRNIPLINLKNLSSLMKRHGLEVDPVPLPRTGTGQLFFDMKYDLRYVFGACSLLILLILAVIAYDKKQNKLGTAIINNETT